MKHQFFSALKQRAESGFYPVIPDLKPFSPKEGDLFRGRSAIKLAEELKEAGAPVLSVVTEQKFFHGSLSMLEEIAYTTGLPILRKDFINSSESIEETKSSGASAILLICSMHSEKELFLYYEKALNLGLEVLVEIHNRNELQTAVRLKASLVGINNRDITSLETDNGSIEHTVSLIISNSFHSKFLISESGIKTPEDVKKVISYGANAVLVGTALLKSKNIGDFYRMLSKKSE